MSKTPDDRSASTGQSRFVGPDLDALTPAQAKVASAIASGPRGKVVGPLRVWLNNPELAQKAQSLGQYARYDSVLPPYLSELAILVTARYWSSGFEWTHHVPLAQAAGHSDGVIACLAAAKNPTFPDDAAAAVFDFAVELHRDKRVSDTVYERAEAVLGLAACVDLVAICGYYTLISMTINAFGVPEGTGPRLPEVDLELSQYFRT